MGNLSILLIIYLLFFVLALILARWDITSPSVLFFGSFCIMLVLAAIYQWFFEFKIKDNTIWIFLGAGITFFLTECIYKYIKHKFWRKKHFIKNVISSKEFIKPIEISNKIQYFAIVFNLLVVVAAFYRIILCTDSGTWGDRVRQFEADRRMINYISPVPFLDALVGQTTRISNVLVHVFLYIVIYNRVICGIKINQQKALIFSSLLYVPMTIFQGVRQPTVDLLLYCLIVYITLRNTKKDRVKMIKIVPAILLGVVVSMFLFAGTTSIVGGVDTGLNAIQYVVLYLCGGLKNFDELIVGHPRSTKYFGQSSFSGIYAFLIQKFHILPPEENLSYHAYGFMGDTSVTIFGRWYEDFGATGVIIMSLIVSLFFVWLYEKSLSKRAPSLVHIIYAQQVVALVWASFDDRIAPLITPNNIVLIIFITIFYRIFIGGGKYRFSFGGKEIRLNNGGNQT